MRTAHHANLTTMRGILVPTQQSASLLKFARQVIESAVRGQDPPPSAMPAVPQCTYGGVFVTLYRFARLRGCIGRMESAEPLVEALREAALESALRDPRFAPLSIGELPDTRIEISILSPPEPAADPLLLEIGKHGVLIQRGMSRGLFLPKVAVDHRLTCTDFLSRCCSEKAGLPAESWKDPQTQVMLFTADVFSE